MGFAADAARQQQWMDPGILFANSRHAGAYKYYGGYGAWATPVLTPSSAASSSTGPASRPLTPDSDNHVSTDTTAGRDNGRARGESTSNSGRASNKTGSPPRLPALYRLSIWPDFTAKPDDDISGGVSGKDDSCDLLGANLGDSSPTLATAASPHDDKPDTSIPAQGGGSATGASFSSFRLVATSSGSAHTTIAATTPEPISPGRASMAGPTHMAVSARPLTAKEYQRYRSQRRGGLSTAPADKTAGEDHEGVAVGPSDMARGRSGSACGKGPPTAADRVASEKTVASEKKLYRQPPNSSPAFLTKEEFEALPPAIQRKYFSTLEQLRLTHTPNVTIDSSQATNDFYDFSSTTLKLRKARRSRINSDQGAKLGAHRPSHGSRTLSLDSAFRRPISRTVRSSPSLRPPAAGNKALSIIIDTADEAGGNQGKSASQAATQALDEVRGPDCLVSSSSPTLASNMATLRPNMTTGQESRSTAAPDSFMESFSFLQDAHDDLDLRLQLDAFDENSEATHPARSKLRPSFRKHLSISKINLSRTPQPSPSSRPGTTKDRSATPTSPPPPLSSPISVGHGRRKSRTLSLRGGNRSVGESVISPASSVAPIDPDAAHYQDPEARLKLRVYLASPQKFDEAIEFGFPSADTANTPPGRDNDEPRPLRKRQSCFALSSERTAQGQAVLADDKSSIYSDDDASMPEPDSPRTPEPLEKTQTRALRAASDAGRMVVKPPHDYGTSTSNSHTLPHNLNQIHGGRGHAQSASREMTLRMTLTRPDLRACDDHIYGWKSGGSATGRNSPSPGQKEDGPGAPVVYVGDSSKDSIEKQFAEMDRWAEPERGVVRRFWDRVRRQ